MINVNSISNGWLYYSSNRTSKYNPKVYMSAQNSVAYTWNVEKNTTYNTWPESYLS